MNKRMAWVIAVVLGLLTIVFLWAGSASLTIFFWRVPALQLIPHNHALFAGVVSLSLLA